MSDFAKFDSKKLAKEIDDLNLEEKIKNYSEINEKYDFFHKLINNSAPIREKTKEEMKRKKTKYILLKQFLKNKDRLIYLQYKAYRDKINHLIRKSRRDYYNKYFQNVTNNMKKTWRQINKIININKHKDKILCIKTGSKLESDPYLIGNTFSNYFTIVAKNLASKINTNQSFSKFLDKRQKNSVSKSSNKKRNRNLHKIIR